MHRSRITLSLSLCALVLAGCQTMGGQHAPPPPSPAPPPANSYTKAPVPTNPAPATASSPWEAAHARGMIFRATGQAPDWSVEVQKSKTPTLFVMLNDSQRQLQVPDTHPVIDKQTGTVVFRGNASDGTPVELTIRRGQCQKDMNGEKLDASADLNIGARQYQGCGKFLFQ